MRLDYEPPPARPSWRERMPLWIMWALVGSLAIYAAGLVAYAIKASWW